MRTPDELQAEIEALERLRNSGNVPDDATAQASIAGQISVLRWVLSGDNSLDDSGF